MAEVALQFDSELNCSRETLWQWITSVRGIRQEMRPLLYMTAPVNVSSLADLKVSPGLRLFRSYLLVGGLIPVDFLDLSLDEVVPGEVFVEKSVLGSMRSWRHERRLEEIGSGAVKRTRVVDELRFEPRFAAPVSRWLVRQLFDHRHRVLRRVFGGTMTEL